MNLEESFKFLDKADDALNNAVHSIHGGFIMGTVNRAYYTMFYCMNAMLILNDVHAKTHQGTRSKFNELYIKTNIFEIKYSYYVSKAFDLRQDADYDLDAHISEEEAQVLVDNATEFYKFTKQYVNGLE
jgi:uncharacterized protein (UPF0332 family)